MAQAAFAYHIPIKPPPTADELPYEDGIPMESPKHRDQMNMLIDLTNHYWHERDDYYVGGNMFIYFSETQARNRDYRGPDFFIVKDGVDQSKERKSWVVWEEDGRYPDLIIELLSESTAEVDKTTKKHLYERTFKTLEYFCYDVFSEELIGWRLNSVGVYEEISKDKNRGMWSESLNLWLSTGYGTYHSNSGTWLRFYDDEGNMTLTFAEAVFAQAEQEAARAEQEAARAEQEAARAEQEAARAEQEAARANLAEEKMVQMQAELDQLRKAK